MPKRDDLLNAVAKLISDYREGEIATPNAAHVDRWIRQFPDTAQEPILSELTHVFGKTYFTRKKVEAFLSTVVSSDKFAGDDPCAFWRGVQFLRLQTAGNSQHDMLALFEKALKKKCGLSLADCGAEPHTYVYLDDVLFSGGRIKSDIVGWIKGAAPKKAKLAIITIGIHALGQWFAGKDITTAAKDVGKTIDITWWRVLEIEDRKSYMTNSDVLRPTVIPPDPETQAYVAGLGAIPILRIPGQVGERGFFSSDSGRSLLEQRFLIAGVQVRKRCPHLNIYMRPLGNSMMKTMGFGSMVVTFRNCPNNAPLVLWAGNPWYPLFPRKTN